MMRLVQALPAHLSAIHLQPFAAAQSASGHVAGWLASGPCSTLLDDEGEVVAMAGIVVHSPRLGDAWFLASSTLCSVPVSAWGSMRAMWRWWLAIHELRRVTAYVRSDWREAARTARFFGFEREAGPLLEFGPEGADYDVWRLMRRG